MPFYYARENGEYRSTLILPLLYYGRQFGPESSSWSVGGILARGERDGPEKRDFRILEKLVRVRRDGDLRQFAVSPFVSYARDESRDFRAWSVLAGLLGRERRGPDATWRALWFVRI